jgi:hypothetical protein
MSTTTMTHDSPSTERKFPPIAEICVLVLALMVIGGVYVAAHLPSHVSLALPTILSALAGTLWVINAALLSRIPDFAWNSFFKVARWTLLAEGAVAAMLEYVFVFDGTRGSVLFLMSSALVIFVLDLSLLFGFSVAQFQDY